jgi:hypothetical protein
MDSSLELDLPLMMAHINIVDIHLIFGLKEPDPDTMKYPMRILEKSQPRTILAYKESGKMSKLLIQKFV